VLTLNGPGKGLFIIVRLKLLVLELSKHLPLLLLVASLWRRMMRREQLMAIEIHFTEEFHRLKTCKIQQLHQIFMENLGAGKTRIPLFSVLWEANATSITKRSLQMISYTQRRAASSMAAASCQLHYRMIRIFTIQKELSGNNPTRSSRVFLGIDPGSFRIYFTRHGLSFALVNAIEIFLAPANFSPENYTSSSPLVLHTIYRVNVGGQELGLLDNKLS
ncbi:hypothetical protein DVH24_026243, partial [Malus domestica]